MQLAVPVSHANEVEALFNAGATEFYCGLQDEEWRRRFGDHDSISRRQGAANLNTFSELEELLMEAHKLKMQVMLTLNGNYTDEQLPYINEIAMRWEKSGGDGVILSDLSLLLMLEGNRSKLTRVLSLLANASNAATLDFYRGLGVTRAVMPRFLTIHQIKEVLAPTPQIEGEALIMFDKCNFIDGFCRCVHAVGYSDAPCEAAYTSEIYTWDTNYRIPVCWELLGEPATSPACGACAVANLKSAGINIFKVGGRGRSLDTRLRAIKFLIESESAVSDAERRNLYKSTFGEPCANCYY